jgi:DNA-binding CsgD family transcriptional regulator
MKTIKKRSASRPGLCPYCGAKLRAKQPGAAALTPRQKEVIRLIAKGQTAKEIAATLDISSRTAEFHRMSLMQRLGVRTTAELTLYAADHHLL